MYPLGALRVDFIELVEFLGNFAVIQYMSFYDPNMVHCIMYTKIVKCSSNKLN